MHAATCLTEWGRGASVRAPYQSVRAPKASERQRSVRAPSNAMDSECPHVQSKDASKCQGHRAAVVRAGEPEAAHAPGSLPLLPRSTTTPSLVAVPPGAPVPLTRLLPPHILSGAPVVEGEPLLHAGAGASPEPREASSTGVGGVPLALGPEVRAHVGLGEARTPVLVRAGDRVVRAEHVATWLVVARLGRAEGAASVALAPPARPLTVEAVVRKVCRSPSRR